MTAENNKEQERYIRTLEKEIDNLKAKYKNIYDSMYLTDKIAMFFKKQFNPVYCFVRDIHHRARKNALKTKTKKIQSTDSKHDNQSIDMIYIDNAEERINLVLSELTSKTTITKTLISSLKKATEKANKNNIELRIITRNSLAEPDAFLKILKKEKISIPNYYSFYSDAPTRLSSPIRCLEVGRHDIFVRPEER